MSTQYTSVSDLYFGQVSESKLGTHYFESDLLNSNIGGGQKCGALTGLESTICNCVCTERDRYIFSKVNWHQKKCSN